MSITDPHPERWILLRGLSREGRHWGDFPRRLQAARPGSRVVCLDLPGAGSLYREPSATSIAAMVEQLRQQWRQRQGGGLSAPPCHLLALSLGGMVAFEWQRRYPGEIRGAVLINTSMRPYHSLFQRLRPACYLSLLRALGSPLPVRERLIYRLTCGSGPMPSELLAHWCRIQRECPVSRVSFFRQLWAAARYSAGDAAPSVPLLLLSGQGDRLVRPDCSRILANRWQVPLAVHPEAGHDLPLADPDWVVEQVQAWAVA